MKIDLSPHPHDTMAEYNAYDCCNTYYCYDQIWQGLEHTSAFKETYDFTARLIEPLMYMSSRGILIDEAALAKMREEAREELASIEPQITELCGRWVNPNSPKQVAAYFYDEKGIPAYKKAGKVTTDDIALSRIAKGTTARKGYPEARLMQRHRGLRKLIGTYLELSYDSDKRLRCSYKPRGTKFGRLSSAATIFETGTNMQNLPPSFKHVLRADPGYILAEIDKSQAEWVVVAYAANEPAMIRVVEEGLDAHSNTAALMLEKLGTGVPLECILQENKLIGHSTDASEVERLRKQIAFFQAFDAWLPRTMSIRQMGKKSNHGLNYMEGYKQFALINELIERDAKTIVQLYTEIYPGVDRWWSWVKNEIFQTGFLENLYGDRYPIRLEYSDDLWKSAVSFNPQSTVAKLVNKGIIGAYYDPDPDLADFELLAQVHDSILVQFPAANVERAARGLHRLKAHMDDELEVHNRKFRIGTDCKIGGTWGNMVDVDYSSISATQGSIEKWLAES